MYIRTETGSVYHYDTTKSTLARLEYTHGLRRDGEALKVEFVPRFLEIGERAMFTLEGLGEEPYTMRMLSVIQNITLDLERVHDEPVSSN